MCIIKNCDSFGFFTAGIMTTPQLHYLVWSRNAENPPSNIDDYYHKIATAFTKLLPEVYKAALSLMLLYISEVLICADCDELANCNCMGTCACD